MAGDRVLYNHRGENVLNGRYDDFAIPHVLSFGSILRGGYASYLHLRDEAMLRGREYALDMARDSHLAGIMQERKLAVAGLKWHLAVEDEFDPEQLQVRDHLTKAIERTKRLRMMFYYLLGATWYGRYGSQMKLAWQEIDGLRTLCIHNPQRGFPSHLPINGDKIGHRLDHTPYVLVYSGESGAQLGPTAQYDWSTEGGKSLILQGAWRERVILHKHEIQDADFFDPQRAESVHGIGLRDLLHWIWWLKYEYMGYLTDFLERVGLGTTMFLYDASNPASKAAAVQAAHDQSRRTVITWPYYPDSPGKGGSVQRLEVPVGGAAVIQQLMAYLDGIAERLIIGQTLSSDSEGSGLGGTGVAWLHATTKQKIIQWDAENLAETLTEDLVGLLLRYTFPGVKFPVRFMFDITEPDPERILGAVMQAVQVGVSFKTEEVRNLTGLSTPEPDDDVIGGPAALAQQQGADQQGQGGQPQPAPHEQAADELMGQEGDPAFDALEKGRPQAPEAPGGPQQMRRQGQPWRYGQEFFSGATVPGKQPPISTFHSAVTKAFPEQVGKHFEGTNTYEFHHGQRLVSLKPRPDYHRIPGSVAVHFEGHDPGQPFHIPGGVQPGAGSTDFVRRLHTLINGLGEHGWRLHFVPAGEAQRRGFGKMLDRLGWRKQVLGDEEGLEEHLWHPPGAQQAATAEQFRLWAGDFEEEPLRYVFGGDLPVTPEGAAHTSESTPHPARGSAGLGGNRGLLARNLARGVQGVPAPGPASTEGAQARPSGARPGVPMGGTTGMQARTQLGPHRQGWEGGAEPARVERPMHEMTPAEAEAHIGGLYGILHDFEQEHEDNLPHAVGKHGRELRRALWGDIAAHEQRYRELSQRGATIGSDIANHIAEARRAITAGGPLGYNRLADAIRVWEGEGPAGMDRPGARPSFGDRSPREAMEELAQHPEISTRNAANHILHALAWEQQRPHLERWRGATRNFTPEQMAEAERQQARFRHEHALQGTEHAPEPAYDAHLGALRDAAEDIRQRAYLHLSATGQPGGSAGRQPNYVVPPEAQAIMASRNRFNGLLSDYHNSRLPPDQVPALIALLQRNGYSIPDEAALARRASADWRPPVGGQQ